MKNFDAVTLRAAIKRVTACQFVHVGPQEQSFNSGLLAATRALQGMMPKKKKRNA